MYIIHYKSTRNLCQELSVISDNSYYPHLRFIRFRDKMLAKMTIKTNINSHDIKHLNIFKKGFFPQLREFSTGLCTLSNKNPQQVASDNYYLTSRINLAI